MQAQAPPKTLPTRQVSPQEKSTAMVLIGYSKRVVVDNQARRFGNKRHTGTFPLSENIKAKALVPLKRQWFNFHPARKVERVGLARSDTFDGMSTLRGG